MKKQVIGWRCHLPNGTYTFDTKAEAENHRNELPVGVVWKITRVVRKPRTITWKEFNDAYVAQEDWMSRLEGLKAALAVLGIEVES